MKYLLLTSSCGILYALKMELDSLSNKTKSLLSCIVKVKTLLGYWVMIQYSCYVCAWNKVLSTESMCFSPALFCLWPLFNWVWLTAHGSFQHSSSQLHPRTLAAVYSSSNYIHSLIPHTFHSPHPPPLVPPFLLVQSLSPNALTPSDTTMHKPD